MRNTISLLVLVLVLAGCSGVVVSPVDGGEPLLDDASADASVCTSETPQEPRSPREICANTANSAVGEFDSTCTRDCPWLQGDASDDELRCDKGRVHDCLEAALSTGTCGGFWDAIEAEPACAAVCPTLCL